MRWEDLEQSSNIEDRRGEGGYVGGGGGGGFGGLPIGGGGFGLGTIAVIVLVGWGVFGINPIQMIAMLSGGGGGYQQSYPQQRPANLPARHTGTPTDGQFGNFVSRVLGSTEVQWKDIFSKDGQTYRPPVLVMYTRQTDAACGQGARSAMGPFYCPPDHKVYLDTSFFREIETRFHGCSGRACEFSQAYVIAHEVGHHVQNLLGILPQVNQKQRANPRQANALQVRVELQADCFAGVWANHENARQQRQGKPPFIDQNDVAAAMQTASAIGDDTLQRNAGRVPMPDSFTHGTGAQRQRWFTTGLQQGTIQACDTFSAANL